MANSPQLDNQIAIQQMQVLEDNEGRKKKASSSARKQAIMDKYLK